ncbi:MAG: hypothetical protein COA52_15295 [Hyphomicrobiales bacterium]|nr:MAG: hypothetical protein COA52_15295 [Hyphomicrobiales bacterium]
MDIAATGAILAKARLNAKRLDDYPCPPPQTMEEAYAVQDVVTRALDTPIVGWKVGATAKAAREMLGVDEPFCGPLLEGFVLSAPGPISVTASDLRIVEAEIAFRMKRDLPSRNQPYAMDDIVDAIATVHPVFEIANKRLPGTIKDNVCWLVADGGVNQAFVYGPGVAFDPSMDMAAETVQVSVDGKAATTGIGATALGNPLAVVVWLANHLSGRNIVLKAGDWVSTGLICDVLTPDPGATLVADYKTIGSVQLNLV